MCKIDDGDTLSPPPPPPQSLCHSNITSIITLNSLCTVYTIPNTPENFWSGLDPPPFFTMPRSVCNWNWSQSHKFKSALFRHLEPSNSCRIRTDCRMVGGKPTKKVCQYNNTCDVFLYCFYSITSQELQMLSTVTLDCQVTKIVMNSGYQL